MNWFPFYLMALNVVAASVTALPSGGKTFDNRAGTDRFVFAHLIVGIVSNREGSADWDADMQRAKACGIDAFALNIGTDSFTDQQLQYAYASAQNNDMKVFISFDFKFWGTGDATAVGQKIAQYASFPAQLMVDGKVFVSSFVGDGLNVAAMRNAAGVPVYFAPNFRPSYGTDMSTLDGALNWMGWPNNGSNRAPNLGQTGTVEAGDSQYISNLGSGGYIAPASPWFFTHYGSEVSYGKNWLFPGDLLWYQRWTELLSMGSRFIEIISWNDYGESHYVGPLSAPHTDDGASKWANDMPHDGWLDMAKPFIKAFKAGATKVDNYIASDQLFYWYRPQPMNADCDATDTCMSPVNNPDYYIGRPNGWQTVTDNIFVVSLLTSAANLQVNSGGNSQNFSAPAGASSFSVAMGVGQQNFKLTRNSQTILSGTSLKDIISGCVCGIYNFNAYVGSLPEGSSDPLAADGLAAFTNGVRVSSCAATPSLAFSTRSPTSRPSMTLSAFPPSLTTSHFGTTPSPSDMSTSGKDPSMTSGLVTSKVVPTTSPQSITMSSQPVCRAGFGSGSYAGV